MMEMKHLKTFKGLTSKRMGIIFFLSISPDKRLFTRKQLARR